MLNNPITNYLSVLGIPKGKKKIKFSMRLGIPFDLINKMILLVITQEEK